MTDSKLIQQAKSLIEAVKGKVLSIEERKNRAIELAALLLEEAERIQTRQEKKHQAQLAGMMQDPVGMVFTTTLTDQCFRSHRPKRIADQLAYVINQLGVPRYLPIGKRFALHTLAMLGKTFASVTVPLTIRMIRRETSSVILPGEAKALARHMEKRRHEGVRINLNHLGEAILGEEEALRRLQIYLDDLAKPEVEYISIKVTTIFSQINLLAWEETLIVLKERLRHLYRAAMNNHFVRSDGSSVPKFVNLDMEEYRDLHLTVALFQEVLNEPEFYQHEAGIVLQSYLPDSYQLQQQLTNWAMGRLSKGGAPIKIRIVKGANLAMEQIESAFRLWPQAPYPDKADVDSNFKRMLVYGCKKEHAQAAHLGIGSHNLFDIAYALLLRAENDVEKQVSFEMLEGMADHLRRVVQQVSGSILLYCPAAKQEEFQNAVAYLVRRLDENTAPDNFLRHAFDLKPGTKEWDQQVQLFSDSCFTAEQVSQLPRRTQNREEESSLSPPRVDFENEPDTDWSLPQNQRWAKKILSDWKSKPHTQIPLVIAGETITQGKLIGIGIDPSYPDKALYHYIKATEDQAMLAIDTAKWSCISVESHNSLLAEIANQLRLHRADLIGAMVADTGKTVFEADIEVSEAIDFAEYYRLNLQEWHLLKDIHWKPKGTVLVAPPWNFPCSIPAGGILAALATGNCVLFKPAPESILVGWVLAQLFWKAGVSQSVLQFIPCDDDPVGSQLVKDPRVSAIVLTGATATAKLFLKMRPGLDLIAETGGKNVMVITGMSDRDLAIKDLLQSAFGHSGQKCSACSLAILEAEVYDDPHFLKQLRDAASSLPVGTQWNPKTKINPLIRPPNSTLYKGLTHLEEGESWLLKPKQDPTNSQLWSPGIKLGVKLSSFTFQHELFGPVLGLVRADNLKHAFALMNETPYGLTAGIHSLDEREQKAWLEKVKAGNCYINRTITGAIVQRQPFGGCKESNFGKGAKAGGPNYLTQLMVAEQTGLPFRQAASNDQVNAFTKSLNLTDDQKQLWQASIGSYAYAWNEVFSKWSDPSKIRGEDNVFHYVPHSLVVLRGQKGDSPLDLLRFIAAALTCGTPIEISLEENISHIPDFLTVHLESNEDFAKRIIKDGIKRVRVLQQPSVNVLESLAECGSHLHLGNVLANGRLELLHLLREVAVSRDYHRYGLIPQSS